MNDRIIDVDVEVDGTRIGFVPQSDAAKAWIDEHVEAPGWAWLGNRLWTEGQIGVDIMYAMADAGLTINA